MATTATNLSEVKKYTDDVAEYQDTLIITKPKNKNVVVISEAEYRSMKETLSAEVWQKIDEATE